MGSHSKTATNASFRNVEELFKPFSENDRWARVDATIPGMFDIIIKARDFKRLADIAKQNETDRIKHAEAEQKRLQGEEERKLALEQKAEEARLRREKELTDAAKKAEDDRLERERQRILDVANQAKADRRELARQAALEKAEAERLEREHQEAAKQTPEEKSAADAAQLKEVVTGLSIEEAAEALRMNPKQGGDDFMLRTYTW